MGNIPVTCCSTSSEFEVSYAKVQQEDDDTARDDPFFAIFKSSSSRCPSFTTCDAIQRAAKGLKYYQSLHIMDGLDTSRDEEQFMQFCQVIYTALLNDYIHIITTHDDELSHVSQLIMMELSDACDVNTCDSISRQYSNDIRREEGKEWSDDVVFYVNIMDSIHSYLVHSDEIGLRPTNGSKAKISTASFETYRAMSCQKFNIDMNHFSHHIFRDNLYTFMLQKSGMNRREINQMWRMFIDQDYDSEAIQNDIELTHKYSNIAHDYSSNCYDTIRQYLNINDSGYTSTESVEIGYKFFYWNAYKTSSQPAFGGYCASELYITQKYDSLKEEILHNDIFTLRIDEFAQSAHKTMKYMATQKVKKCQCFVDEDPLQFGIHFGTKLSFSNLLSLLLWCDWPELCLSLKSTLRPDANVCESIESVANRNGEYWNWSKLLRETIEYFGDSFCRNKSCVYSGCNTEIVLPHLYLKLNSVTSCSRQMQVIHLNNEKGIILELNDCGTWHDVIGLDSFAVNWCSKYCHENEMLFCGGNYRIKIQNIYLNHDIKSDLSVFLRSLFNFEFMVSGNESEDFVTKPYIELPADYDILDALMRAKTMKSERKYPKYIHDTFQHVTNSLNSIIINLDFIHRYFKKIRRLLMYEDDIGLINVPKEVIWSLFPNLQQLIIYTTDATGQYDVEYPLNLIPFLYVFLSKSAANIRNDIKIIIYATHKYEWNAVQMMFTAMHQSWISDVFTDDVRQQYKERGFDIQLTQQSNENANGNRNERIKDCLRITKRP